MLNRGLSRSFWSFIRNRSFLRNQRHAFSQNMMKNDMSHFAIASGVTLFGAAAVAAWFKQISCYPPSGLSKQAKSYPDWIQAGLGDTEYVGKFKKDNGDVIDCSFPADKCPDKMPDLSNHTNFLSDVLKANPELYDKLKDKKTKNGVTLAKCIKTGIDNPGHPMNKTCGIVAGDEESLEVFKDIFDPIISAKHGGYPADAKHVSDLDWNKLSTTKIDPTCDEKGNCKYVQTSSISTSRSVRGIKLSPSITFEERRELERIVTDGLTNLGVYQSPFGEIDLRGEYWPLNGSKSYSKKKGGMCREKEQSLRDHGNLFQEPKSASLLSSGIGRHWPDGRGIFHNANKNLFVWLNEEDHMRIIAEEKGGNVKRNFARFATTCNEVQKVLKANGHDFMHNERLGYISTSPSNLGTGLRASALLRIPLFSQRKDFKKIANKMGLNVRYIFEVSAQDGVFDISNINQIGKSEVVQVNTFIEGASKIVKWEQMLGKGENIDNLVNKV